MSRLITALLFMLLTFSSNVMADNGSTDKSEQKDDDGRFRWEIMLELSLTYDPTFLKVAELDSFYDFVNGGVYLDLSYKKFFFQTNRRRANTFTGELGYQLIDQKDWGLDLIGKVYLLGFDPESIERYNNKKTPKFEQLKERNHGGGIALRYSRYDEDAIFTADLATLHPSIGGDSWLIELYYSHLTVYKNWDIYTGAGLTYFSQDVVDYHVGIDQEESSRPFPVYDPSDGLKAEAEIFALYPMSQDWTLSIGLTQNYYSNSFSESPIGIRQHLTQFKLGIRYVF